MSAGVSDSIYLRANVGRCFVLDFFIILSSIHTRQSSKNYQKIDILKQKQTFILKKILKSNLLVCNVYARGTKYGVK